MLLYLVRIHRLYMQQWREQLLGVRYFISNTAYSVHYLSSNMDLNIQ